MPNADVGVIVGRFQVHRLHDAHRELINSIYTTHAQTIVVLGLSPVKVSIENPLDFESRRQMILESFPKATVLYITDEPTNEGWSRKLDKLVGDIVSPAQTVCMYGGRASFLAAYCGKYPTAELEQRIYVSGTEIRKTISKSVKGTEDFRAGVIWASANQYPRVFPTVDVAIYDFDANAYLLVRKANEPKWRFCGGFVDPNDASFEAAARREVQEETGIAVENLQYIASIKVDDWRYRRETDKIITTFYLGYKSFGGVRPADDVAFAQWFPADSVLDSAPGLASLVVPEHEPLIPVLCQFHHQHFAQRS